MLIIYVYTLSPYLKIRFLRLNMALLLIVFMRLIRKEVLSI